MTTEQLKKGAELEKEILTLKKHLARVEDISENGICTVNTSIIEGKSSKILFRGNQLGEFTSNLELIESFNDEIQRAMSHHAKLVRKEIKKLETEFENL